MSALPRIAALSALLAARSALACSLCVPGDPLDAAGDAASPDRNLRLSLETEWLSARAAMAGRAGMEERVERQTLRVGAIASVLPRLDVALLVPLVRTSVEASGAGVEPRRASASGLGDVELGARLFLLDRGSATSRRHGVAFSGGTSLPTGPNDRIRDGVGDERAQVGTGAFGPCAGVLYELEQSRWHGHASVNGRYRTQNAHGLRHGGSLGWTLQGRVQLLSRLAAGLALDGREVGADEVRGVAVPNTGGLVVGIAPSLHVDLGRGVGLGVRAQVPVATRLRGEQEVGPAVVAGVQLRVL